jgi:peptidoglycan/xylan/chitin deacetylase (PgdA/CDA1 family)
MHCYSHSQEQSSLSLHRKVKHATRNLLTQSKFFAPLRHYFTGYGSILAYHRIFPNSYIPDQRSSFYRLGITESLFEEHIRYITQHHNCLTFNDAASFMQNRTLPKDCVMITFDDGYKDNMNIALPIMEKYKVPFTVYVCTGFIDKKASLWWYEVESIIMRLKTIDIKLGVHTFKRDLNEAFEKISLIEEVNNIFKTSSIQDQTKYIEQFRAISDLKFTYHKDFLTWDELRAFSKHPLVTIGAHTVHHPALACLNPNEMHEEIFLSKIRLEEELRIPVNHFAFPFGKKPQCSLREFQTCKELQFATASTTRFGHLQKEHFAAPYSLPRIAIDYHDSIPILKTKLSGIYAMILNRGKRYISD